MTGALVAALILAACWVLALSRRPLRTAPRTQSGVFTVLKSRFPKRPVKSDSHEIPLFVHQLTGLLQAGRTPSQLWGDALGVHGSSAGTGFSVAVRPALHSAHQAAQLGLSVPDVLREVGTRTRDHALRTLWQDLAACLEVAERSGAPLADVLARYAVQRESQLDSDAARDTALAGPRATVRLLSWLPLFGLAVGYLIGVDPLEVLLDSVPGIAALCAGLVLMIAGRIWSSRLVRAAAGDSA
ncbi:type II secretion system F family protein [uncultured Arthrobacter sp.]|uniref:type II secretion system F family protein n=1 Tax=uncultured Arthrobacter sp. TaxID=114050 RepID=UPI0026038C11|nr:type II secretion system F family protein [uncultured Arthrobacter sp.]